jgi:uncharacterized membrane protein YeaQ/YmgE (transglycosylase-associated protein family)
MFSLIAWIIVGGISGWIASMLVKGDGNQGWLTNIVVGMVGSLVGGTVVTFLSTGALDLLNTDFNNFNLVSVIVSVLGAVIFLSVLKAVRK